MKTIVAIVATLLCFSSLCIAAPVSGKIDLHFDLSQHELNKKAELWIPYPVSDENQLIEKVTIKGDFAESGIYTDREHGTTILYARWDKGVPARTLDFSFEVSRDEVIRKDFPSQEPAWNPADYAEYLQPTSYGPTNGEIKKLADSITAGQTTVLGKAKAIYDWTCENMFRDPNTVGCGKGDVCSLLKTRGGKCTDIHSVYVALARAAGVPAREILGLRQGKKEGQELTSWQHCWAQFFLPGYGWVPVDPADVRKMMLKHDLTLEDQQTKDYRSYFWGGIDPYRIKLSVGRDITLNPKQQGGPLNTFGYPYAEIGGKALDFYNPAQFSYTIIYHQK